MAYTIQNIIDRTRIYVDDNHKVTDGWKEPADWLLLARPEIIAVYKKWLRESLISFSTLDGTITSGSFVFPAGVPILAVLGVAQQTGQQFRLLQSAMSQYGRAPFWESGVSSTATTWTIATDVFPDGNGDPQTTLDIHPPDSSAGYLVRYIRCPEISTLDKFIIAPEGYEDYMALRIARKALASEGASSQAIERLIISAEADMKMDSLSNTQGDGPKVRITRPYNVQRMMSGSNVWPNNPMFWYYP